jgi:hypothetical protein
VSLNLQIGLIVFDAPGYMASAKLNGRFQEPAMTAQGRFRKFKTGMQMADNWCIPVITKSRASG